ncbi:MAG: transposase zinc-binding domain-containing protein [Pirellulaceae bacterium]
MKLTVQQIFQQHSRHTQQLHLAPEMWRAATTACCRTGALGMHRIRCVEGHELSLGYNSCRHRFGNNCAALSREKWLAGWSQRLARMSASSRCVYRASTTESFVALQPSAFSEAPFAAASQSLLMLLDDPKYLGARPGLLAALHTLESITGYPCPLACAGHRRCGLGCKRSLAELCQTVPLASQSVDDHLSKVEAFVPNLEALDRGRTGACLPMYQNHTVEAF